MTLVLLSFLGGILTILSPCILPVLPFVFARADKPFMKSGLPLLAGMAVTFALVATLAAVGGSWVVHANQYGRFLAIGLFVIFGLTLLFPAISDRMTRPLVALGNRLSNTTNANGQPQDSIWASLLLGVATGLLWAPCAGPILGLLLTTAAVQGASATTTFLLLAYALGAATSLAIALFAGGRVFAMMKRSIGAGEWVRRGLGVAVLAGAVAIGLGLDTGFLTRLSFAGTNSIEQSLLNRTQGMSMPGDAMMPNADGPLPVEGQFPSLAGGIEWINSPPLTPAQLRGKVVVVDFWTYSCINCLRSLPYVRAWAEKYRDSGLVVIGVHSPEFAFERDPNNVRRATRDLGVSYPVVLDNNLDVWRAFQNRYWPAHYFIDAQGRVRAHHYGEGSYDTSERIIQRLLVEAGATNVPMGLVDANGAGVQAAAAGTGARSPETYVGYSRRANFASPETARDANANFTLPPSLTTNQWGLTGAWSVAAQAATAQQAGATIRYRFRAHDLHLVLGAANGHPVRFRVTIDGHAPGAMHGTDTNPQGQGVIRDQRLYQLVRGGEGERTFEIEFLDPGAQAFAFTFG